MIVFLHGWGMSKSIFVDFVEKYLDGKEVLLLDLPGYSKDKYENNFDDQVKALKGKIPKDSHVVAWSLGGLYILRLLRFFPNHIKKLTLTCSSPCFMQRDDFKHALTEELLDQFNQGLVESRQKTIERFLLLQLFGQKNAKQIARDIQGKVMANSSVETSVLEFGLKCLKEVDCREDLQQSKIPIHFILGGRDKLVPKEVIDDLNSMNKKLKIDLLIKQGHMPFITNPEEFYQLVFEN